MIRAQLGVDAYFKEWHEGLTCDYCDEQAIVVNGFGMWFCHDCSIMWYALTFVWDRKEPNYHKRLSTEEAHERMLFIMGGFRRMGEQAPEGGDNERRCIRQPDTPE